MNKKIIRFALLIIVVILTGFVMIPYMISPVYDFSAPKPFSGNGYYNPYQHADSLWKVCNFHAHSRSWGGITDGKNTDIDTIFEIYQQLGYSHIGISNYQKITNIEKENIASIPTYEHGYNIKKRHHLCLGTDKVSWLDFIFFQTLNHKQFMLNQLRNTTDFLVINHPKFSNGFDEADFLYLSNYDAVEVFNHYRTSITHWDSALSAGYYAVLIANDDMHNLKKMDEIATNFTVINTNSLSRYDIIQALKAGRHYGVKVCIKPDENYQIKAERIANLVHPNIIEINGDTINVNFDTTVNIFRFIGQGGQIKDSAKLTNSAKYVFKKTDSYIRIEINDMEDNLYLFNPIVKTDEYSIFNQYRAEINWGKTIFKYTFIVLLLILFVFVLYWRKRKLKKISAKSYL